jgi:ketopantoate reductase
MNILIIGTGVIGCVYGWQLSLTGNKVTHFVRKGKKTEIDADGIVIRCLDTRIKSKPLVETLYKPDVVEDINNRDFELIIVPVKANQLSSILPLLAETNEKTDILFLQNLWVTHLKQIESVLNDSRIVYGQAHMTGGGKNGNVITCTIFGNKSAPTMLGKKDGTQSRQVYRISEVLSQANLNPVISKNILAWLFSHYAEANGLVAGVMEAGSAQKYVLDQEYIKHSIKLIIEGFKVCSRIGVHAWKIYPQVLYYGPLWILAPSLLKMYRTEEAQLMIRGHISHSPDEMKEMFYDVLNTGINLGVNMPCYEKMKKYVDAFT